MVLMVTGKKIEAGVPGFSQETISESFTVKTNEEAEEMFKKSNPGFSIAEVKMLEPPKLKKYVITCNEGSLGASGAYNREMMTVVMAESEEEARSKFTSSMANRVYGRRITAIREAE